MQHQQSEKSSTKSPDSNTNWRPIVAEVYFNGGKLRAYENGTLVLDFDSALRYWHGTMVVLPPNIRLCQEVEPQWLKHPNKYGWWAVQQGKYRYTILYNDKTDYVAPNDARYLYLDIPWLPNPEPEAPKPPPVTESLLDDLAIVLGGSNPYANPDMKARWDRLNSFLAGHRDGHESTEVSGSQRASDPAFIRRISDLTR